MQVLWIANVWPIITFIDCNVYSHSLQVLLHSAIINNTERNTYDKPFSVACCVYKKLVQNVIYDEKETHINNCTAISHNNIILYSTLIINNVEYKWTTHNKLKRNARDRHIMHSLLTAYVKLKRAWQQRRWLSRPNKCGLVKKHQGQAKSSRASVCWRALLLNRNW